MPDAVGLPEPVDRDGEKVERLVNGHGAIWIELLDHAFAGRRVDLCRGRPSRKPGRPCPGSSCSGCTIRAVLPVRVERQLRRGPWTFPREGQRHLRPCRARSDVSGAVALVKVTALEAVQRQRRYGTVLTEVEPVRSRRPPQVLDSVRSESFRCIGSKRAVASELVEKVYGHATASLGVVLGAPMKNGFHALRLARRSDRLGGDQQRRHRSERTLGRGHSEIWDCRGR